MALLLGGDQGDSKAFIVSQGKYELTEFTLTWLMAAATSGISGGTMGYLTREAGATVQTMGGKKRVRLCHTSHLDT